MVIWIECWNRDLEKQTVINIQSIRLMIPSKLSSLSNFSTFLQNFFFYSPLLSNHSISGEVEGRLYLMMHVWVSLIFTRRVDEEEERERKKNRERGGRRRREGEDEEREKWWSWITHTVIIITSCFLLSSKFLSFSSSLVSSRRKLRLRNQNVSRKFPH